MGTTRHNIQSVFQRTRLPRLAHARGPDAHQLAVAQPAAARHTQAARERGGIHCASAPDRVRDRGGGVLAVRQLLVARAGGHPGRRLTRVGGRVHARVAPALRRRRVSRGRGVLITRTAAAAAACARAAARRAPLLPRRLSAPALRHAPPPPHRLLTRARTPLVPAP